MLRLFELKSISLRNIDLQFFLFLNLKQKALKIYTFKSFVFFFFYIYCLHMVLEL